MWLPPATSGSRVEEPVSTSTATICVPPGGSARKTTLRPSADQRMKCPATPAVESCRGPDPSAFITQT